MLLLNYGNGINNNVKLLKYIYCATANLREGWSWTRAFANWRSKSFVVALRSKSYNKDWEQTARPEPPKMFNFYEKVLAKGLAQNKNYEP